jgi:hypothetical protein
MWYIKRNRDFGRILSLSHSVLKSNGERLISSLRESWNTHGWRFSRRIRAMIRGIIRAGYAFECLFRDAGIRVRTREHVSDVTRDKIWLIFGDPSDHPSSARSADSVAIIAKSFYAGAGLYLP